MTSSNENLHVGHRERIRERFRQEGLTGFSEHEVLELLLTYSIPYKDVNPIAHELIREFGSLAGVLEADESELLRVSGVGSHTALLLRFMPQLLSRYQRSTLGERPDLSTPAGAHSYCASLFMGIHEERIFMLCLDQSGRLIHPALLHKGTIDAVSLYPREVVATALRYHAQSVILTHNHPGGIREPSQADYDTTKMIIHALEVIGVRVIDHLIVTSGSIYSMAKGIACAPDGSNALLKSTFIAGKNESLFSEYPKE